MKRKQSQITIFLIIVVFAMLLIIMGLNYQRSKERERTSSVLLEATSYNDEVNSLSAFVTTCLSSVSTDGALYAIKKQSMNSELLELRIEEYIERNISVCLENLSYFQEKGLLISNGIPVPQVTIYNDTISILLIYPLDIQRGEYSSHLQSFQVSLDNYKLGYLAHNKSNHKFYNYEEIVS